MASLTPVTSPSPRRFTEARSFDVADCKKVVFERSGWDPVFATESGYMLWLGGARDQDWGS
jgi:hypothetical protein